jgi:hypothetical protein
LAQSAGGKIGLIDMKREDEKNRRHGSLKGFWPEDCFMIIYVL